MGDEDKTRSTQTYVILVNWSGIWCVFVHPISNLFCVYEVRLISLAWWVLVLGLECSVSGRSCKCVQSFWGRVGLLYLAEALLFGGCHIVNRC